MTFTKRLLLFVVFFTCFFTSKNCSAQKINQFDSNNNRIGVWKKYHPNKRIRYTGQFIAGKEVGVFKFYDVTTSEKPVIIKTFYKKSDSVFVQFYTLKGQIKTEGFLIGRKRTGAWKYFYANGKLMSQEMYKEGVQHGEQIVQYPNGKVTEKAYFKNGVLAGLSSKYSSKGILIEAVTYKNGKPNGLAKYFELNGDLKESGFYKEGKRAGKWAFYLAGELVPTEKKNKSNKKGL